MLARTVLIAVLANLASACIEELLDRTDASQYGYTVFNGPTTWGEKFKMCNGYRQSPVELDMEDCHKMRFPKINFLGHADERDGGFRIHNTFQSVSVEFSGEQPVLQGGPLGSNFTFSQMHFHWGRYGATKGAEHQIKDLEHAMEAHLVHFNSKYADLRQAAEHWDGLAIISLLFTETKEDSEELSPLVRRLRRVRRGDSYALLESGAMTWLEKYLDGKYLTYWGSLTTPPCNEVVTWIVLENSVEIGWRQIEHFRMLYGHEGKLEENVRPLQPIGKRYVFCPSEEQEEEEEPEATEEKKKESSEESSEELDSEESSEEEDDDRKLAKPRPLWLPKKQPYLPFSTYRIVSG